jgi:hypothetical protein
MEGFSSSSSSNNTTTDQNISVNVAGGTAEYANNIKTEFVKLTDSLNISKYRTDYENTIIQMDDYISALMVQEVFKLNGSSISEDTILPIITKLNTLNAGKQSLNSTMKIIDSVN